MLNQVNIITTSNPIQIRVFDQTAETSKAKEIVLEVFCDLCAEQAHGTRRQLEQIGWGLYRREAFCPMHEEMV